MPPVIPYVKQTWTDGAGGGTPTSAARLAVIEQGIFDAHNMPTVKAVRTAVQTVTNGTWTLCAWSGTDAWDSDTMHDPAVTNGRLIAKHAGKFQWTVNIQWANNATGTRILQVQKLSEALPAAANTGVYQGGKTAAGADSAGATLPVTVSGIADLSLNDWIAVVVYQNSGGNLDIGVDSYFSMTRMAT